MENNEVVKFHNVLLSHNSGLRIDEHGVELSKVSSSNSNSHIHLSFQEWFDIVNIIPELSSKVKNFAKNIFDQILRGSSCEDNLQNFERIISDKVAIAVSVFKPETRHFISISIRSYFYSKDKRMLFKKFPGVTLNQDEFFSLKSQAEQVNNYIGSFTSGHIHDDEDQWESCKLCTQVQKHIVDKEEEINPFAKKTEFSMNCQDPSDFIPVYRRIHEFAEKGKNDQVLVLNLKKNFELLPIDDNDCTTAECTNISSVNKRAACDTLDTLIETPKAKKSRPLTPSSSPWFTQEKIQ